MLKKTITYTDFNGNEVSEDYFFHLSKAELVELEMSHQGGLSESLGRIVAAEDTKAIIAEFKNILLGSYGQKSIDGKRFVKNQTLRDEFESSEAYSTLFMELVTDTNAAIEFINGVIPAGMAEEAAKLAGTPELAIVEEPVNETKPLVVRTITEAELKEMPREELVGVWEQIKTGEVVLGE